jgi:hypothetical protein
VRLSDALTRGSFDAERSGDGALSELHRVASYAWNAFGGYRQRISACSFNKNHERRCSWKPPIQPWRSKLNKAVASNAQPERWCIQFAAEGTTKTNRLASVQPQFDSREGHWLT